MNKQTARNILNSRVLIDEVGTYKNLQVTNVSFNDTEGNPWRWEEDSEGSSAGEKYAIANFNAMNPYSRAQAITLVKEGEFQEACNKALSLRVTPELGLQLKEAMYATVVASIREVEDENTGEMVETILLSRAIPIMPKEATTRKVNFDKAFGFEDEPKKPKRRDGESKEEFKIRKKEYKKSMKRAEETAEELRTH